MNESATGPGAGRSSPWPPPVTGATGNAPQTGPPAAVPMGPRPAAQPYPPGPPPVPAQPYPPGWPSPTLAPPGSPWAPGQPPGRQIMRMTSGLFPSGPSRPIFREPFPVRGGAVALGMVGGGLWMMLFGLLASNAGGYVWITIIAGIVASLVALLLVRTGDRGAAAGVAMSTAVGLAIATIVVVVRWVGGDWLLW